METKKITNLEELINQTKQNLKDTGYSSTSLCVHGKIWRELSEYLSSKGIASYAPVNGLDYLHYKINYPEILERTLTHDERDFIRAIRFLNEYQENGAIPSALPRRRIIWDSETESLREEFEVFCQKNLNSRSTVKSRMYAASRFMQVVLIDKQVKVEKINAKTISEYAAGLSGYSKATATVHLAGLRFFFRFLYEKGYVKADVSPFVPRLHGATGEKIPHILSEDDVRKLLASIDRGNPIGKRNYAILLMAALLGMRDSDITNLTFSNLDWEKNSITFFQKKTSRMVKLPLLPAVGDALIDYLKYGRPQTDSNYVFVKHKAPFEKAVSFYCVMSVCISNAGISVGKNVSHGLHILRHTLASELVRQGEAYSTVSAILGHSGIGSTDAYTHIDLDGLLKCALELQEVTSHE